MEGYEEPVTTMEEYEAQKKSFGGFDAGDKECIRVDLVAERLKPLLIAAAVRCDRCHKGMPKPCDECGNKEARRFLSLICNGHCKESGQ